MPSTARHILAYEIGKLEKQIETAREAAEYSREDADRFDIAVLDGVQARDGLLTALEALGASVHRHLDGTYTIKLEP